MGIPAFFRWLCDRFPKVVIDVIEDEAISVEGVEIPIDSSKPNPNKMEFDNLYLDMNNIIHACTHPTDRPAPESEEEMMVEVSRFIDRLFSMVRPRKFLYMAIDGVAPRAKMNQQRSRRFRTAREAKRTAKIEAELREKLINEGKEVPDDDKAHKPKFDSNCITPGTPFMDRVAKYLEYYIADRICSNPGWKNVKVLLSDSNTPGEGEHKIVHWIRQQRSQPSYDPNTRHAFYGLDADLIMLALATHEPNFFILREIIFFGKDQKNSGNCFKCGQPGHRANECTNEALPPEPEEKDANAKRPYQFLRIDILREYLNHILFVDQLPFEYDLERALDDFVFLCFFVGNDFLPHLPTLEIRENAIGLLLNIYRKILPSTGYLTKDGDIYLDRVEVLLKEVGYVENNILVTRLEKEKRMKENAKRRKESEARRFQQQYLRQKQLEEEEEELSNLRNAQAAEHLRRSLTGSTTSDTSEENSERPVKKVKLVETPKMEAKEEEEPELEDPVKLGEEGWRERYYLTKFKAQMTDSVFFKELKSEYIRGLAWVLKYYYSGCPSWGWYYPYHYAPFSAELVDLNEVSLEFELGTPFRPLQQLMAVLPPASAVHVPKAFQPLMLDKSSPIIEFYPEDFPMDHNGKKQEWLHIALLPFIDEKLLFAALSPLQPKLSPEEVQRNEPREELLYVNSKHPLASVMVNLITSNNTSWTRLESSDIVGLIKSSNVCLLPGKSVVSPYPDYLPNLEYSSNASIHFKIDPVHNLSRGLLAGVTLPPRQLTMEDFESDSRRSNDRSRGNYYNNQNSVANRMINHYTDSNQYKVSHHQQDRHQNNYKPYNKDSRPSHHHHRDNNRDNRNYDNNNRDNRQYDNNRDNRQYDNNRDNRNYDNNRDNRSYDNNRDYNNRDNRSYDNNRDSNRHYEDNRSNSYRGGGRGGRGGGRGGYNNNYRGGGHNQPVYVPPPAPMANMQMPFPAPMQIPYGGPPPQWNNPNNRNNNYPSNNNNQR